MPHCHGAGGLAGQHQLGARHGTLIVFLLGTVKMTLALTLGAAVLHIGSSSIYRGELSFLPPVQFCICSRDSAVLTGYLFQQGPACVHVPNWKNVLQVSGVVRCVWHFANWKNVLCHKMSMCMSFC